MKTLLIGTNNEGKVREFTTALRSLSIILKTPSSLGFKTDIQETGASFEDNALIKARGWAAFSNLPTLVDDSGLCVDALEGAPGIYSTRFYPGSDLDRNNHLLELLKNTAADKRTARYVCALAFFDPATSSHHITTGICEGRIARNANGEKGFGYDPLFIPSGYNESFGALAPKVKEKISHRAQALAQITPFLQQWSQSI